MSTKLLYKMKFAICHYSKKKKKKLQLNSFIYRPFFIYKSHSNEKKKKKIRKPF